METHTHKFSLNQNIGRIEACARTVAGFLLIGTVLAKTHEPMGMLDALLPLFGIYLVNSAIVHWDPLYECAKMLWNHHWGRSLQKQGHGKKHFFHSHAKSV